MVPWLIIFACVLLGFQVGGIVGHKFLSKYRVAMDIDRSVLAIQMPLAYSSYGELDCVRDQMGPQIEKQLEAKGFVLLGWTDAGWAHFFTKSPVRTPDDMKKLKMFVWAGDDIAFKITPRS